MSSYSLESRPTSNQSPRSNFGASAKPTGITIHWWGAPSAGASHNGVVSWLRGAAGGVNNKNSSAHYVVSGRRVTQLAPESRATWHSGNRVGNGTTIGIEMHPRMSATDWATLVALCADIERRHGSMKYYRHHDWKATACPGVYSKMIGQLVKDVNAVLKGKKPTAPKAPKAQPKGSWFDMATEAQLRKIVKEEVRIASWAYRGKANKDAWAILREILSVVKNIRDNSRVRPWLYKGAKDPRDMHAVLKQTDRNVAAIRGTVDGLVEAVKQIDGVDPAEIGKAVNKGVSYALSNLEADVSLNINTDEEVPTEPVDTGSAE